MKSLSHEDSLMKASAKFILGESSGVKIKGTQEKIETFQRVLHSSRDLYDALCEEASLDTIMGLIQEKKKAAAKFHQVTGILWRL